MSLQPQLIAHYGYPVQTHSVRTEDGYILELHRIPHGKSQAANSTRPAVLMHHALLCSSFDWIALGPEKSLGEFAITLRLSVRRGPSGVCCSTRHHIPARSLRQLQIPSSFPYIFLIAFVPFFLCFSFLLLFCRAFVLALSLYFFLFEPLLRSVMFLRSSVNQIFPAGVSDHRRTFSNTKQCKCSSTLCSSAVLMLTGNSVYVIRCSVYLVSVYLNNQPHVGESILRS